MRRPSLQRRLLWLIGLPVAAVWLAGGLWLGQRTVHETAEMFDRELERTAASVLTVLAAMPDAPGRAASGIGTAERRAEIVVRDRAGHRLVDASALPAQAAVTGASTFRTLVHRGERWRVYQRWDAAHRHWVQVAAPLHDRDELLAAQLRASLVPLAGLLLMLPVATWLGLRRGLAPLHALSRAIAAQPVRTPVLTRDDVPAELVHLTRALDALVANLDATLARERRFTADAAHELRHPLSVLRMELDLARASGEPTARRDHLQRAREGLDRMERLVAQLLTLARVESLDHLADAALLPIGPLVRDVVAAASERAMPRGVDLSLRAEEDIRVRGGAGLLAIALSNMLDNAITHGRPRGSVAVEVRRAGDAVEVVVDDDGPGIDGAQAARLGERFLRGDGQGSGLGLSIVQAIAALHGGTVTIARSSAGGARVALRLPIASAVAETPETRGGSLA
jgi:two-component system, OmpR family, sensor histidine kinase QseC